MPEGPSIVILKETMQPFNKKKIISAEGNATIDFKQLNGKKISDLKSWGKHFLICFNGFYIRIHLLMFGTYSINEKKKNREPRLNLRFNNGEINFYTCNVKLIEGNVDEDYDWEADIMSEEWNATKATKKIKKLGEEKICDVLLDQQVFSGVGNIIKNEVLFRVKIHPETLVKNLPAKKIKELIKQTQNYSFDFYNWKKTFELKKHWLIYNKKICPRCNIASQKKHLGKGKRLTCFCNNCQIKYM